MVTVVDPFGTPYVIYNRSGLNIQEFTLVINDPVTTTVAPSGLSYFVCQCATTINYGNGGIELPTNAEVGDEVVIFNMGSQFPAIAPTGETINGYAYVPVYGLASAKIVKYDTTKWVLG